ncbi:uncharacterized protein VNE69_05060 [Vairimorpha necatrix]|uniref:Uncharacterized protein n=1 Tax=Vairimorpha necatrix TaxID=6039 RepID=A0AAX4JBW4_9MICR
MFKYSIKKYKPKILNFEDKLVENFEKALSEYLISEYEDEIKNTFTDKIKEKITMNKKQQTHIVKNLLLENFKNIVNSRVRDVEYDNKICDIILKIGYKDILVYLLEGDLAIDLHNKLVEILYKY